MAFDDLNGKQLQAVLAEGGRSLNIPCGTQGAAPVSTSQTGHFLFTCLKCPQICATKSLLHRAVPGTAQRL